MALQLPPNAQKHLNALLARAEETHTDSLAISWRGASRQWTFGKEAAPIQTMSVTKSVVGLVIGRLVTLGKLTSVDEPVHAFFPEWRQGRKKLITVRMLMEHTSGLQNVPITIEEIYPSPDFVQLALCAELDAEPGTTFAYNNKAVNLLAGIVERTDGRKLDAFAREELLRPLGIADTPWLHDDAGNPHAMSGLALQASDLARLGELILQRGDWNGSRLIDERWLDAMDAPAREGSEPALMWWHLFESHIEVTEDHLSALEEGGAGAELINLFQGLRGEHRSLNRFFINILKELGDDWRAELPSGVTPFNMEIGESIAYRAEGDLGQFVFVVPGTELVAARLVSESTIERLVPDFRTPPKSREEHMARIEPFFFPDFEELVFDLSRELAMAT